MKKVFLGLLASAILFSCKKNNEESLQSFSADKDSPEALLKFIPENYQILDTARGDLNLDGKDDLIMVLETKPEVLVLGSEQGDVRPMLLLLTNHENQYELTKRNFKAIYCKGCVENVLEPFSQAVIHGGQFGIIQKGSDWKRTLIFAFQPDENDWYLQSDELTTQDENSKTLTQSEFGKVKFEDINIYND